MIHMLPGWRWPAGIHHTLTFLPDEVFPYIFNVADSLLCTGVGLMLIYSFFNTTPDAPVVPTSTTPRRRCLRYTFPFKE